MIEYNVLYRGLNSTNKELQEFMENVMLNTPGYVDGFRRGLIVIKNKDEEKIMRAYSVAGYFISIDEDPGDIKFKMELKSWGDKQIEGRLKTGKVLETIVELDEDAILERIDNELNYPLKTTKGIILEEYLMDNHKAFPFLKSSLKRARNEYAKSMGI